MFKNIEWKYAGFNIIQTCDYCELRINYNCFDGNNEILKDENEDIIFACFSVLFEYYDGSRISLFLREENEIDFINSFIGENNYYKTGIEDIVVLIVEKDILLNKLQESLPK